MNFIFLNPLSINHVMVVIKVIRNRIDTKNNNIKCICNGIINPKRYSIGINRSIPVTDKADRYSITICPIFLLLFINSSDSKSLYKLQSSALSPPNYIC